MTELLQDVVTNIQQIIRSEVLLARTEVKEEGLRAARAGSMLAAGAAVAFYGLGFLLLCCVYALSIAVPHWAAALIVGVVLAAIAGALLSAGVKKMKNVNAAPQKTIESVKENVQWAKSRAR